MNDEKKPLESTCDVRARLLIVWSPEGIYDYDLVVGWDYEAVDSMAKRRLIEYANDIHELQIGGPLPPGGIEAQIEYLPDSNKWQWADEGWVVLCDTPDSIFSPDLVT